MIERVESSAAAPARGRILVIEDDPDAALFAVHVLATRGQFDVTHTADPVVALRLTMAQPWDLILTEAELPGISGIDLLQALRRIAPATPIAVLTVHEGTTVALRHLADEFLEKPVRIAQLLATAADLVTNGRRALTLAPSVGVDWPPQRQIMRKILVTR
jgi:DNA-binding response OmpR family regulator